MLPGCRQSRRAFSVGVAEKRRDSTMTAGEPRGRAPRRRLQHTFAEDLGDLGLELERGVVRLDIIGSVRDICVGSGSNTNGWSWVECDGVTSEICFVKR